eukprot:3885992-Rhodomonas_salina.2
MQAAAHTGELAHEMRLRVFDCEGSLQVRVSVASNDAHLLTNYLSPRASKTDHSPCPPSLP